MGIWPEEEEREKSALVFFKNANKKFVSKKVLELVESMKTNEIGLNIEFFDEDDLVVNITKHKLVPKHEPLNIEEKKELLAKYSINDTKLPKILTAYPVSKYFGMKRGDVFKIVRDSETAG